jgi:hypothetical protein
MQSAKPKPKQAVSLYERDFYAWAMTNAELLRAGRLSEADIDNIAEELESIGRSDKRELASRLAVLLGHLLKWQFQPERRGNSWRYSIQEQRLRVADLLEESPSLRHTLEERFERAYKNARLIAAKELDVDEQRFPERSPFDFEQATGENFWPE